MSGVLIDPAQAHAPIVARLVQLIEQHQWAAAFEAAIACAAAHRIAGLDHVAMLRDYLRWLDELVRWAPREQGDSQQVHDKLVAFHFFVGQPSLRELQSPISPAADGGELTPLSAWIVDFAREWGRYLDTCDSARHIDSFRTDPLFRWDDYMPPPSGYLTFNQFFARHVKPGRRPVDALHDDRVVVAPADANFVGQWAVDDNSTMTCKGMRWSLVQLLEGSPHARAFAGGVVTHSALRTFDYHRWHAPLAGTVREARIIRGQAWLGVEVVETIDPATGVARRTLEAQEGTGYQFVQSRGLVVLETAFGLVACMPVGMAQVSSVVITAEVGTTLRKGEEMGYFQFGGSDFVMVFAASCGVQLDGTPGAHSMQGVRAGRCAGAAPSPGDAGQLLSG